MSDDRDRGRLPLAPKEWSVSTMLLDRIEIDSHGPLNRVELGPLSHHLNVVLGASGSGKTAISRFIRDSLIDREYPRGMLSGSAGRVVWVDQNGWIHCRREQDGTPGGRRTVEFESRSETMPLSEGYADGWFDGPQNGREPNSDVASRTAAGYRSSLASRTLGSIRIPESIVDGVMVDTTVSSVSRVAASCIAAGLDRANLARLPFENETAHFSDDLATHSRNDGVPVNGSGSAYDDRERRALRSELADVEAELAKLESLSHRNPRSEFTSSDYLSSEYDGTGRRSDEYESLVRQRDDLGRRRDERVARREDVVRLRSRFRTPVSEYANAFDTRYAADAGPSDIAAHEARLRGLHQRADALRSRASELQRWLQKLDAERDFGASFGYSDLPHPDSVLGASYRSDDALPPYWQTGSPEHLQNRIRAADQEIVTLHRVLSDVRGLRQLLAAADATTMPLVDSHDWLDDHWLRGQRYDHFVRAIDRYRSDRPWSDFYSTAYQSLRPVDDLAMRIEATTRHLDWLLSRFDATTPSSSHATTPTTWMLENDHGVFIEQSLRRVRSQLRRREYVSPAHLDAITVELTGALDYLNVHRRRVVESLAAHHSNWKRDFAGFSPRHPDWIGERRSATQELATVESELRRVLDQTASLRYSQRALPIVDPVHPIGMSSSAETESLRAEVRWLDHEIAQFNARLGELERRLRSFSRPRVVTASPPCDLTPLRRRRDELIAALRRDRPVARRESSLLELASRWLIRLSGGRHRVVSWTTSPTTTDPYTTLETDRQHPPSVRRAGLAGSVEGHRVDASIDNVNERDVPAATRAIACLAVRLAAGELLGRMGHAIPLVLETHHELFMDSRTQDAYQHWTREGIHGDALCAALADYAAAGRQLLVLTEHNPLADMLRRSGARSFELHTQRIVHPHRPMWRNGQRHDAYAGPHAINVDGLPEDACRNELDWTDAGAANRAFDHAWRETAGLREEHSTCAASTDRPVAGASYRDGYYYANQTSTHPVSSPRDVASECRDHDGSAHTARTPAGTTVSQSLAARHNHSTTQTVAEVPFFLTVDSPIDAAPSIDAVAAQRLRRIGISHITHLMNQDSNRLADTLGLAGVEAKTIRRWQSECRLMCRVPQLRGFDARVLVGCGIADPAQLAAIHPTDLLDRVKTFLATERGQRILLSGTSYELSRITSWIASANQSVHTHTRTRTVDGRRVRTSIVRDDADSARNANSRRPLTSRVRGAENDEVDLTDDDFDQERYEVEVERRADRLVDEIDELARDYDGDRTRRSNLNRSSSSNTESQSSRESRPRQSTRESRRSNRNNTTRSSRRDSDRERRRRATTENTRTAATHTENTRSERDNRTDRGSESSGRESSGERVLRFYLERSSDVVDAPSIGPRMAERLNKIGIYTVNDLLRADASEVASGLRHRRVDASTVLQWQQQTTLVCRVPMMRGHDAQFLVAAGVTTPEELAASHPVALFAAVDAIAQSNEGKQIVRGGKLPDLAEVTEWIGYASQHRSLQAA